MKKITLILLVLSILMSGKEAMTMELTSESLKNEHSIANTYTCEGQDKSPPLKWKDVPKGTKSLCIIADDPDAPTGTWTHWVVYNLPHNTIGLPEGMPSTNLIKGGGMQGINSFNKIGYGGPCPPKGSEHRYFFKLYALDTKLEIPAGISREQLEKEMQSHILDAAVLTGKYGK